MKYRDLVKALQKAGWVITSGGNRDIARNPEHPEVIIPIPRHKEIPEMTARES